MNIQEILDRASKLNICVVGDLILDRYIFGDVNRLSPEGPIPIVKITGTKENPGGAGNVVENLKGLGCQVDFFYDRDNTIIKTRIMSGSHHLLRLDDEDDPKWMRFENIDYRLEANIKNRKYNCVVISDYHKGMISEDVAREVIGLCVEHDIPVVAESKSQLDIMDGSDLVKCNRKEWEEFRRSVTVTIDNPWEYMKYWNVKNLVITNGAHGIQYNGYDGDLELSGNIPAKQVNISDICGAGDTTTAVLSVMQALGYPIDVACELANIAGAEVCKRPGVYAIQKEDLMNIVW